MAEEKAAKNRGIYAEKSATLAAAMEELRATKEAFEGMKNRLEGILNELNPKIKQQIVFLPLFVYVLSADDSHILTQLNVFKYLC